MARYAFVLHGCTQANIDAVKAALANIPGLSCNVTQSARGEFIVFVESLQSESEVLIAINAALAGLGVQAQAIASTSIILDDAHTTKNRIHAKKPRPR